MRYGVRIGRLNGWTRGLCLSVSALAMSGCASPPSVNLLLRSAETAIAQEQKLLDEDAQRQVAWASQRRAAVDAGFESDVRGRPSLDVQWILEGVSAYTEVREHLMRSELQMQEAIDRRRENMKLAGEAIERGAVLLERQDELLAGVPDLRRWVVNQLKETKR